MKARLHKLLTVVAVGYPLCLLGVILAFRWIGERWWVTSVGLFLPRIGFVAPLLVLVPLILVLRRRSLLWSQALAAFLALFPLMGFVLPGPASSVAGPTLRVLSFNVNSAYSGAAVVAGAIREQRPDVVLLQEHVEWSKLEETLRETYPVVSVSGQFLVASRFPILSQNKEPDRLFYGTRDHRPRFMRYVIQTPLGPVTFYSVHPLSPRETFNELRGAGLRRELASGRLFAGKAGPDIEANAGLRALQIRTFGRLATAEAGPVVLAGDTNQPTLSPLLSSELGEFRDAFRQAGWGFGYTFPTKRPWLRLDRILVKGPLAVTSFATACRGVSDHLCVVADIGSPPR